MYRPVPVCHPRPASAAALAADRFAQVSGRGNWKKMILLQGRHECYIYNAHLRTPTLTYTLTSRAATTSSAIGLDRWVARTQLHRTMLHKGHTEERLSHRGWYALEPCECRGVVGVISCKPAFNVARRYRFWPEV